MKKFFKKMGDYNFWVSLSAGLIILFNAFGNAFGFSIKNQIVEDCVMAVAGMLMVFGIVNMKNDGMDDDSAEDNSEEKEDLISEDEDVDNKE